MDNKLYVWVYLTDANSPSRCGEIDLVGGRFCRFSYAREWLENGKAFPLSPDLPLRAGEFEPPSGLDIHPIFEDAAPDAWGRRVIDKIHNPRRRSHIDYLALAGENRIGALGFSWSPDAYVSPATDQFNQADLAELMAAAKAIEDRLPVSERMMRFLRPGSNVGGARPKALIRNNNTSWIAKFEADGDIVDVAAVEYASQELAARCGIETPSAQLIPVRGRNVLLVKRFDRAPDGSRIHFASARTMLLAQGNSSQDMSYWALAETARKLSAKPKEDCLQVFRRMIFNVLIENTDDHEKNHAFLFGADGWRLAPAYDVQPQLQGVGYQQLLLGKTGHEASLSNALSEVGRFMLTQSEASHQVDIMIDMLLDWKDVFRNCGVSDQDIDACDRYMLKAPGVSERLKAVKGMMTEKPLSKALRR